jgi:endoglucanase
MYTLLDLQWLQADTPYGPNRQFIAPLPDAESAVLWRMLAERYRDEPAVLFDLYTEPHDCTAATWSEHAQRLADAVWQGAPEAVVFVAGTHWAYDLRDVSVTGPAVVYSTHIYRNKGSDWEAAFGYRAAHEAVFAGEWGGRGADRSWGARLLAAMDDWSMGWCAWSLTDEPFLQEPPAPTEFGHLVQESLREG